MRLLANENFPGPAVDALRAAGHDVLWARLDMPGADDPTILGRAQHEQRIVLTFDKDFGDLAFTMGSRQSAESSCFASAFRRRRSLLREPLLNWQLVRIGRGSLR